HYSRENGYSYAQFEQDGFFLMVTEVAIQYKKAMQYGQQLTVRTWLETLKSRSLVFGYEVVDYATQTLHATATTTHICLTKQGQLVRLPQEFIQHLQVVKRIH
ncbi:MAG: acyl-CoA thioesterase, partial [Phototrophicaceae bacterium]